MNPITNSSNKELPEFLSGGGDMGRMIRQLDWSATSLGPVENWPQSLRSAFSICLNSNFPIAIYWGPELNLLYNDAWSPIPGNKHPWALGRPAREVWPEIWEDIAPQFEKAFTGVPGGSKDALLPMKRHGYTEECYFDFTFTPVYGEGGKVEGVFNAVTETTYRIINERRNAFLKNRSLNIAGARSLAEVYRESIRFLGRYSKDISFALLFDVSSGRPSMVSSTIPAEELDRIIGRPFDLEEVLVKGHSVLIPDLKVHFTEVPHHIWPEEPREGYILPVRTLHDNVDAIMVLGLNARRGYDEEYRVFLEGIGGTLVTVMQNIKSLEEHKMKADALAEIDRAKTTFFSNISHEFRTPLTLLLSPLEEIMNDPETIPENRHRSEVAYRNGLRMQKLVNMLLEFSRLEAGRVQGKFAKVDIAILTRDLASNFRSAIEKAGMVLAFDITEVEEEIYVDTDMWEIIILNLVSNAFKYSREGEIRIQIRSHGKHVEVSVIDTGIGIPEKQLDKVFDRFHRVENTDGRSQEGTGIGLSLVRELVKMHGGAITVESEVGRGSAFIILLPTGRDHLPADKIIENRNAPEQISQAAAFVNEALKWLPEAEYKPEQVVIDAADMPLVLLCDDNADMRNYVRRLLAEHFRVVTARDGVEALLKAVEYRPDLILTDVMMPKLDGFGLLERIRQQQEIKNTPVIFLSARAGAEAKMEGLDAGADDYIVKPFSARELLVRIGNLIRMTQVRRETEQQFYQLFIQAPAIINVFRGKEMRYELYHPLNKEIFGERDFTGLTIREAIPELEGQGIFEMLDEVYEKGKTIHENERPVRFRDKNGQGIDRFFNFTYQPWYDQRGRIQGVLNYANEVTEMVESRLRLQEREQALSTLANAVPQLVWVADGSGELLYFNDRITEFGSARKETTGKYSWQEFLYPEDHAVAQYVWATAIETGEPLHDEVRLRMKDGTYRWHLRRAIRQCSPAGDSISWFGTATDIHAAKEASGLLEEEVIKRTSELSVLNQTLRKSNEDLQQFAHVASHDLKEPVRKISTFSGRLQQEYADQLPEKAKLFLEKIANATSRMYAMIDGVLSYSTLNASEQPMARIDLDKIMQHIESDLEVPIQYKKAIINKCNLPEIDGAEVLIYQLFYNLINNSLKFSRSEVAPVITISSSIASKDEKDFAVIEVADNGIGFTGDEAERIFNSFTRLHGKDKYEGTGLGLALCRKIAERHHGFINAAGNEGKGAIFTVWLPLKQDQLTI